MGFFPLAGTISSMLDWLRMSAVRSRWPEVLWPRYFQYFRPCVSSDTPPRFSPSRTQNQHRATNGHLAARAFESIRRNALERRHSSTASVLRRWMPPTVERGPPVHISV